MAVARRVCSKRSRTSEIGAMSCSRAVLRQHGGRLEGQRGLCYPEGNSTGLSVSGTWRGRTFAELLREVGRSSLSRHCPIARCLLPPVAFRDSAGGPGPGHLEPGRREGCKFLGNVKARRGGVARLALGSPVVRRNLERAEIDLRMTAGGSLGAAAGSWQRSETTTGDREPRGVALRRRGVGFM